MAARPWLYGGADDEWCERNDYVERCSVCGAISDTWGPCSSYCEEADKYGKEEPDD